MRYTKIEIGLSKDIPVETLFGLTFTIGSRCVPYFDEITVYSK